MTSTGTAARSAAHLLTSHRDPKWVRILARVATCMGPQTLFFIPVPPTYWRCMYGGQSADSATDG
jgi:hypothetical protein